jgi:hypothetical protein
MVLGKSTGAILWRNNTDTPLSDETDIGSVQRHQRQRNLLVLIIVTQEMQQAPRSGHRSNYNKFQRY